MGAYRDQCQFPLGKASVSLLCLPLNLFFTSFLELYYLIARFLQSGPCNKSAQVRGRRRSGSPGDGTKGEVEAAECAVPLKEWPALTSPTYHQRLRGGRNALMAQAASHICIFLLLRC